MATAKRAVSSDKSTTVRVLSWQLAALGLVSTGWVERRALQLFRTPVRRGQGRVPHLHGWAGEPLSVRVAGERVAAWEWGEGASTTLLVHGWNGNAAQLAPLAEALLTAGERVVLFDHLGHGNSGGRELTLLEMRDAVLAAARAAGGVRAVVAHSLGGAATALALDAGLSAEQVVLLAPAAEMAHYTENIARVFDLPPERAQGMLARIEDFLRSRGEKVDLMSVPAVARRLTTPALLLHDPADREVPFAHGARIAAAWRGAVLEPLPNAGHTKLLRDPRVLQRVLEVLAPEALARVGNGRVWAQQGS